MPTKRKWRVNPKTKRKILVGGATDRKLKKQSAKGYQRTWYGKKKPGTFIWCFGEKEGSLTMKGVKARMRKDGRQWLYKESVRGKGNFNYFFLNGKVFSDQQGTNYVKDWNVSEWKKRCLK